MKPPSFDYYDPATVEEAVSLLAEHRGEARILAGGQSLMPLLNMRLARPGVIIDVNKVAELDHIQKADGDLIIGALTRQRAVERSELVQRLQPLLHAATLCIAHPQIRNRGTVGGSLAHGDPAAEYPAVAVALDAELRAVGPNGDRSIKAGDFFTTYLTTALQPDELLTEVRLPGLPERSGWSFLEISRRRGDFALTGAAVTVTLDGGGNCSAARIVLFGVAPTPVRAREAEQLIIGEAPEERLFEQAGQRASDAIDEPLSDVHAPAQYRKHVAQVLTRRALSEAVGRARGAD
jgi:CO/xanthine dehydrogenase FAD-binding subunit